MDSLQSEMDVAYFVLADAAQVVDGKLYLIGGGWDLVWVGEFPAAHGFAICVGVRVPWDMTNVPHTLGLTVETTDGRALGQIISKFEVGKPAGLAQGSAQLINLAFPYGLSLDGPDRFRIRALIDDRLVDEIAFGVVQRQG